MTTYLSPERSRRKWTKAQLDARRRWLLPKIQDSVDEIVTETKIEKLKEEHDQVD